MEKTRVLCFDDGCVCLPAAHIGGFLTYKYADIDMVFRSGILSIVMIIQGDGERKTCWGKTL